MNLLGNMQIPTSKLDLFIRSVEIASYLPGRVRLRSKNLLGNAGLEREVKSQLLSFAEIDSVETSTATGSILIKYVPERLRANAELAKVEAYIMTHAKGR
ncbi:MAG: hypothetical protein E7200_08780 [Selenomonas ruminantium]|nr:hypothetical protein [Selenomonas ruminantium]